MEVTTTKSNLLVNVRQQKTAKKNVTASNHLPIPYNTSKFTRLKCFRKEDENGVAITYVTKDLVTDDIRTFASRCAKITGLRGKSKEVICEAIVDKKAKQDEAKLTGEGEVIAENGALLRINRKRLINVLASERFRPFLLTIN